MENTRYAFSSRFGDEKGTNPEELIAAAHAGCFTMALSAQLTEAGFPPTSLDTRADVDLSMEGGPQLSQIRLKLKAVVPGIDEAKFRSFGRHRQEELPGVQGAERCADQSGNRVFQLTAVLAAYISARRRCTQLAAC